MNWQIASKLSKSRGSLQANARVCRKALAWRALAEPVAPARVLACGEKYWQKVFRRRFSEHKDPHGLNGFILLMHLGSGRKDPLHRLLGPLCDRLLERGYKFERVDALLVE